VINIGQIPAQRRRNPRKFARRLQNVEKLGKGASVEQNF
jgi:hypothetical protein